MARAQVAFDMIASNIARTVLPMVLLAACAVVGEGNEEDDRTIIEARCRKFGDCIAPLVAITSPQAGASVSGSIGVTGTASDNVSVSTVMVRVDSGSYQLAQGTTSWSASVNLAGLAAGNHVITAQATDGAGNKSITSVTITVQAATVTPPPTCASGTFAAQYFNNTTLSGTPAHTRCDAAVSFDWGDGSPAAGIGVDNFSVRWTGAQSFESGEYEFVATVDDGIRVYVDGSLVIDAWIDQPATTYRSKRVMTAGSHAIKIEYYERGGRAMAMVNWKKVVTAACTIGTGTPGPLSLAGPKIGPTGTYTQWFWPAATGGLNDLAWKLTIERDTTDGYFWSHQFGFAGDGTVYGYLGLQANGTNPVAGGAPTKVAVFSIGGAAIRAELGDVKSPLGNVWSNFDGASGVTTIVQYDWTACEQYALRVTRAGGDGLGNLWFAAYVKNVSTGVETFVSRILVPGRFQGFGSWSVYFSERFYGATMNTCADQRYARAVFGPAVANGGTRLPDSHSNNFSNPTWCPNSRLTELGSLGVRHEMGVP